MWDITSRRLLDPDIWHFPKWCRVCKLHWHHGSSWTWKDSSWFEARYMLAQPGIEGQWNENISNLLNHLVDELGRRDGQLLSDSERYQFLHSLCQALRPRDGNWKQGRHHGMLPWLFPATSPITSQPAEFLVTIAQIILGMDLAALRFLDISNPESLAAEDEVFGTLLHVAIRARRHDVVRKILHKSVDVNDKRHQALETAVDIEDDDYSIAEIILDPTYGYVVDDRRFEICVIKSIELQHTKTTSLLLDRVGDIRLNYVAHDGLRYACYNGDLALVRRLIHYFPGVDINSTRFWQSSQISLAPISLAIKSGNRDLVRLLLEMGTSPWGDPAFSVVDMENTFRILSRTGTGTLPIMSAIERNDTEMIRMLLKAKLQFPPQQWSDVFIKASNLGHDAIIEFLINETVINLKEYSYKYPGPACDVMRMFCHTGNAAAVKLFASQGVTLEGVMYADGTTPMQEAMVNGFRDVAAALVEYGVATQVDLQSIPQNERSKVAPPQNLRPRRDWSRN